MAHLDFNIGRRIPGDSRITLFRYKSGRFEYGEGWKMSVSLHPKLLYWRRGYKEFRLTVLGINVHYRAAP